MRCLRASFLLVLLAACTAPAAQAPKAPAAADVATDAAPDFAAAVDAAADPSPTASPAGTWYVLADDKRFVVTVTPAGADWPATQWGVGWRSEVGGSDANTYNTTWDAATGAFTVRWPSSRLTATVRDGVLSGRWCPDAKPCPTHITGWNAGLLDTESGTRAYELLIDGQWQARLRLDCNGGSFKIYSSLANGVADEGLQYDIDVQEWQFATLEFAVAMPQGIWRFVGWPQGRKVTGTVQRPGLPDATWTGERAEVLSHGLATRPDREVWQQATRRRLERLMMAGNPAPLTAKVTVLQANLPPQPSVNLSKHRDDDAQANPQAYKLSELAFQSTLPDPWGGPPLQRTAHAWLATPTTAPPPGGFPAVLALNGHYGSAANTMDPASDDYWYGDALARRGFVVMALDVGHRPLEDRSALYADMVTGDDASLGNALHPAIRRADADSDWEEEGERVYDAMRALDHLATLPNVDAQRLAVTGLSMGGELATWVGALDTRVAATVVAGFSPDLGVLLEKPDNHPCWRWQHGDLREYVDISDVEALIAPRRLVVETGQNDASFSMFQPPFAADKQVLRRTRLAYGADGAKLIHYLHDGEHAWRTAIVPHGIRTPLLQAPMDANDVLWQSDAQTTLLPLTLLDLLP